MSVAKSSGLLDLVAEEKYNHYRSSYEKATTVDSMRKWLSDFENRYDPDNLATQLNATLYRESYRQAKSILDFEKFIQQYDGNDPDSLRLPASKQLAQLKIEKEKEDQLRFEQQQQRKVEEQRRKAEEQLAAQIKTRQIGTKICISGSGVAKKPTGLVVMGKPYYDTVQGGFQLTGFTEGLSGDRIQIRISGITFLQMSNYEVVQMDEFDYQGSRIKVGAVIWDEASGWKPC